MGGFVVPLRISAHGTHPVHAPLASGALVAVGAGRTEKPSHIAAVAGVRVDSIGAGAVHSWSSGTLIDAGAEEVASVPLVLAVAERAELGTHPPC